MTPKLLEDERAEDAIAQRIHIKSTELAMNNATNPHTTSVQPAVDSNYRVSCDCGWFTSYAGTQSGALASAAQHVTAKRGKTTAELFASL